MRILVVASSFPSLHQPWLTTYLEQLIATNIDFDVLSFKSPDKLDKEKDGIESILDKTLFLSVDETRVILSHILKMTFKSKLRYIKYVISCLSKVANFKINWKEKLRLLISGAFYASELIGKGRYDLIHVHFDQDVGLILPYATMTKTPILTTFHGLNPVGVPQMKKEYRSLVYLMVNRIFVNTNFAARQVIELGAEEDKIIVLPQALKIEKFPFITKSPPRDREVVRILTIGRLQRDKGQPYALLALKRLLAQGYNVSWTFVGSGPDAEKLMRLAEKICISERVIFKSNLNTEQVAALHEHSHILVLPSISNTHGTLIETQGVVLQEAQACGTIAIGTRVGGIPECINDKIDGLLVDERSSKSMCDAIVYLLENPEIWPGLQRNGRQNVELRFSSELIGKKMAEHYKNNYQPVKDPDNFEVW